MNGGYAVMINGTSWRAVNDPNDVTDKEFYSDTEPVLQQSPEQMLKQKLAEINQHTESLISSVRAEYPEDEVLSWSKQETEARAYTADSTAAVPLLSAIATNRGVPLDILAEKVIIKSDAYAAYTGMVIGIRQALEDKLMVIDLTKPDALEKIQAIEWTPLPKEES